jgi:glucuronyl/N-acetylglucosaminyl transferase EXT2
VFVSEDNLGNLMEILTSVSDDRIAELQRQGSWLFEQYLSSIKAITLTTLDILNDRVFPQSARNYQDWNMPADPVSIFSCIPVCHHPIQNLTHQFLNLSVASAV